MTDSDLTIVVLREIRDGINTLAEKVQSLDTKLASVDNRLGSVEGKLDVMNDNIEAIGRYAKNTSRRHDKAIEELRERVAKLEARRKN